MARIAIDVMLKPEILDPQGRAVERALPGLGFEGVSHVRVGKRIELQIDDALTGDDLSARIDKMCVDFLTNPIIESFTWQVVEGGEAANA